MDIISYTSYFHDGGIINMEQKNNNIMISMESAEMDSDDLKEKVLLSKYNTIRGILHLDNVKCIKEDNKTFLGKIGMMYDSARILTFEMDVNKVRLLLDWVSYLPKMYVNDVSDFEMEAEKIWWENIPNLYDHFD
jgi:hypothetical protein